VPRLRAASDAAYPQVWTSSPLLFGFAPGKVFHAAIVANCAVGYYPAFSPLPDHLPGGNTGTYPPIGAGLVVRR
jgi:hypothetical protein